MMTAQLYVLGSESHEYTTFVSSELDQSKSIFIVIELQPRRNDVPDNAAGNEWQRAVSLALRSTATWCTEFVQGALVHIAVL